MRRATILLTVLLFAIPLDARPHPKRILYRIFHSCALGSWQFRYEHHWQGSKPLCRMPDWNEQAWIKQHWPPKPENVMP